MASEFSFDIVSEIDQQELTNALDQVRREITGRYDFKGLFVEIKQEEDKLIVSVPDEYKLNAVVDILKSKLMRRNLDLKILGEIKQEPASGGTIRATIPLVEGVSQDKAKLINKIIRDELPKIKSSIQGSSIRVSSKSKDELQSIMDLLKEHSQIDIPLQFTNYR
ncbi:MAG: YajQ family cyclic di-GMP-binding protein [Patescibacteria group bacterium]|nr:YajQ family cyclic di-GMP-binding protein [Patescibacteria group bacterium]